MSGDSAAQRFVVSICGPSGAGKSALAKAVVAALGDHHAVRIPGDYFLRSAKAPMTTYVTKPDDYDWPMLDRLLALPDGTALTTPQFDYEQFVRLAESGGRTFTMRHIALLDALFPYPHANLTLLLTAPEGLRRARVVARDIDWNSNVAGRWHQLEASRQCLKQLPVRYDLRLSGVTALDANARTNVQLIEHHRARRQLE